jgi:predicted anti-sigma-YlaC factor YlaD
MAESFAERDQMHHERNQPMTCQDAQRLMAFYGNDDPELTQEEREAFEAHLMVCPACAEEYEEDKQLTELLKKYWPVGEDAQSAFQFEERNENGRGGVGTSDRPYRPMTVDEGWEDLKRRVPSLAEACHRHERKQRFRQVAGRVGRWAVAACVLLAVGFGMMAWRQSGERSTANDVVAHACNK